MNVIRESVISPSSVGELDKVRENKDVSTGCMGSDINENIGAIGTIENRDQRNIGLFGQIGKPTDGIDGVGKVNRTAYTEIAPGAGAVAHHGGTNGRRIAKDSIGSVGAKQVCLGVDGLSSAPLAVSEGGDSVFDG